MRCFVAVELADTLREPLVRLLRHELPATRDVRWCTPQQLHLTLKFLGEVGDNQLRQVSAAVSAAAEQVAPFSLKLGHLGCFPSARSPRVLWVGMEDPGGGCARWLAAAEKLFEPLGFARETRPFQPHVTLGRSRGPKGAELLRRVLAQPAGLPPREMTVREVVLFESRLDPRGARYLPQHRAPLGGRAAAGEDQNR